MILPSEYRRRRIQLAHLKHLGEMSAAEYGLQVQGLRAAYAEEAPARAAARRKVRTEKDAGRLVKPIHCERCGCTTVVPTGLEAHHPDHADALGVLWVCSSKGGCHSKLDSKGSVLIHEHK